VSGHLLTRVNDMERVVPWRRPDPCGLDASINRLRPPCWPPCPAPLEWLGLSEPMAATCSVSMSRWGPAPCLLVPSTALLEALNLQARAWWPASAATWPTASLVSRQTRVREVRLARGGCKPQPGDRRRWQGAPIAPPKQAAPPIRRRSPIDILWFSVRPTRRFVAETCSFVPLGASAAQRVPMAPKDGELQLGWPDRAERIERERPRMPESLCRALSSLAGDHSCPGPPLCTFRNGFLVRVAAPPALPSAGLLLLANAPIR